MTKFQLQLNQIQVVHKPRAFSDPLIAFLSFIIHLMLCIFLTLCKCDLWLIYVSICFNVSMFFLQNTHECDHDCRFDRYFISPIYQHDLNTCLFLVRKDNGTLPWTSRVLWPRPSSTGQSETAVSSAGRTAHSSPRALPTLSRSVTSSCRRLPPPRTHPGGYDVFLTMHFNWRKYSMHFSVI